MPRGRTKKEVIEPVTSEEVVETPEFVGLTPKASLESQQLALLELRERMRSFGVDSIGKLDAILSQINEQLRLLD